MKDEEINALPNEPALLKSLLCEQAARLLFLEEQFRLAQHQRFGKSSEKADKDAPVQGDLFNEAEVLIDEDEKVDEDAEKEQINYTRNKPKRQPLPKDLPREEVIHDIEDKTCTCCGHELHQMGEERSEKLDFIPAQVKVIEHVRLKYSCRACEKNNTKTTIHIAPVPPSPIPKGIATPTLLSQIITSKYQYALPLYRQESLFKQYGIVLSRQTMASWMMKCSDLFKLLYQRLKAILLKQHIIQADETTLNVIKDDKIKSYMWVYCTGTDSPKPNNPIPNIVLYEYQLTRAGQCAADYLKGFTGYLQTDGYKPYEKTTTTLVGCWAHARRRFMDAKKAQPNGKSGKADMALSMIQKLYRIEISIKDKNAKEKYQQRQKEAKPILDKLEQWLAQSHVVPNSKLGEAIKYCKNQWQKLIRYIEDSNLNIDNNRAERAVKPFVIGRNYVQFPVMCSNPAFAA